MALSVDVEVRGISNSQYAIPWKQAKRRQRATEKELATKLLLGSKKVAPEKNSEIDEELTNVISFNAVVEGQGRDYFDQNE